MCNFYISFVTIVAIFITFVAQMLIYEENCNIIDNSYFVTPSFLSH